jgi:vancomycin resistance protein YoaR
VPDWGGGVCQVSSTLYNAALLSGLEIVERLNHMRPPDYVPLGRDATVVDNFIDFRFKNNLSHHIFITSTIWGGRITVNIYGKVLPNVPEYDVISRYERSIPHRTIVKNDSTLFVGEKKIKERGADGLIITTYRVEKVDGKVVKQEKLATDDFMPLHRIELVGTKPLPPPPTAPKQQPNKEII